MKFGKLFTYAVIIGVLAGFVDLLTNILQGAGIVATDGSLTFVTFIFWASYFLFGANPKAAGKAFMGAAAGIVCAIIIFALVGPLASMGLSVPMVAIPVAVVVGVILMCLCEAVPPISNVAAVFLGAGTFFGIFGTPAFGAKGYLMAGLGELIYVAIGFVAGWLTVQVRVAIEKSGAKEAVTSASNN